MMLPSQFTERNFLTTRIYQKLEVTTDIKCKGYGYLSASSTYFKIVFACKFRFNLVLMLMLTSTHDAGITYW